MKLRCLREECYDDLIENIKNNYMKYQSDKVWLFDYFDKTDCYNETSIEANKSKLFYEEKNDFNNAIIIFESFKSLTPFQATNCQLWTYLTHTEYYDYMIKRWAIDDECNDQSLTRLKERYFCKKSRRGLLRNGISRLWWATYLSYDESNSDHYKYTKILFSEEELFTALMEREFSMCKSVVLGVLMYLNEYINQFDKLPPREIRRELMKYLNNQGAIVMYDVLEPNDVYFMVKKYIEKHDTDI